MSGRWARLRVGQWFALGAGFLGVVGLLGMVGGLVSLARLTDARKDLFDRIAPANTASLSLQTAMLNEETGLRGFVITYDESFLGPYRLGTKDQLNAQRALDETTRDPQLADVRAQLPALNAAIGRWREQYAEPTIASVDQAASSPLTVGRLAEGRGRFEDVRRELATQRKTLDRIRLDARARLNEQASRVQKAFVTFGVALLLVGLLVVVLIRQTITRPLGALGRQTRRVASGDFASPVEVDGSKDVIEVAHDVDRMREVIVAALEASREANEALDQQARDLARSNAELEQFAYVASHDLQEPLRKVASFTQLLAKRYEGQLDERADQYIAFAVDGAKRMQTLINDLLAFSRVGRAGEEDFGEVDLDEALARALSDLGTRIEETGTEVLAAPLPTVRGEIGLLTLLLQNLVGNAIKFQGAAPPRVEVQCRRVGEQWEIAVADNGIGIDPQYADRIFVIFQRLHPKEQYAGTGIGLAMCRKIAEYHGGRIALDVEHAPGTRFVVLLPVAAAELPAAGRPALQASGS